MSAIVLSYTDETPTQHGQTGLPHREALLALLRRGTSPFHLVLIRVEHGDVEQAVEHLQGLVQGQGCLFQIDPRLFAAMLPASLSHGGHLLVQALHLVPGPQLILKLATGSWLGAGEPLQVVRDVYRDISQEPGRQSMPLLPAPAPMASRPMINEEDTLEIVSLADDLYG